MKAPFSNYLDSLVPGLRKLIEILEQDFDYVSVLSTDSKGLAVRISQHSKSVGNQTMTTERGTVVRVYKDGLYSEYAMDRFDPKDPEGAAAQIRETLAMQIEVLKNTDAAVFETEKLSDEPLELLVEKETGQLPEEAELSSLVEQLAAISDKGMSMSEYMLECIANAQSTHICKLFLTKNRAMCTVREM